ncbi:MAG TPA: hypothetical protein VE621_19560 [Bryobacteraceae bacterium]|nr:hypothetical protein [Bryobacteraceae bacterium]
MKRVVILVYGVLCYAAFLFTFLYAIGFIGGFAVPKTIDSGATTTWTTALAVDLGLLALFAIQHSVMARRWFKAAWTTVVPPAAERSTYTLFSSLALLALFMNWEPIGGVIWQLENRFMIMLAYGCYAFGIVLVLVTTFVINHFDLFGLRQVWIYFRKQEYKPVRFQTPALYSVVRHPLYLGWLFTFWSTPTMTAAHLVFAIATTVYILMAIRWEEQDLLYAHGSAYREYRSQVPMILPIKLGKRVSPEVSDEFPVTP